MQSSALSVGSKQLSSLIINRIIPHGTRVRKGQTLVWFETDAVDRRIKEAESSLRLAELSHNEAEFSYQQFLETQTLDRQAAVRARKAAQTTYDNFVRIDRDQSIKSAEFSLKSSRHSLANAMEELKQLEQMYKEDELTEESEEIVLKRAKQAVESAQFRLESSEISTERTIKQSVPVQEAQQKDGLARAELAYQKAIRSLDVARKRKEIEMASAREKLKLQQDDFRKMKSERAALAVTAPHDGIAYHGPLTRGKLSDKFSALKKETTIDGSQILLTVVNPQKQQIWIDLTEAQRAKVKKGMAGQVVAAAYPGGKLSATVTHVGAVPLANNKFECRLSVKGDVSAIAPATSGSVHLAAGAE